MKIGILTFTETSNYGAVLQAIALNQKIRSLGFNCETIDYSCKNISRREKPKKFKEVQGLKAKLLWCLLQNEKKRKYTMLRCFLQEEAVMSDAKYNSDDITTANTVYDKFIVGSDIIWETNVTGEDFSFYLDFVCDSRKKYSYAASFGFDVLPENVIIKCKSYLADFSRISVREAKGQDIISSILPNKTVELVCDPTLLLPEEHWKKYANESIRLQYEDYIFLYFLDSAGVMLAKAKELAKEYGKKIVVYNETIRPIPGVINIKNISVEEFLTYIRNSFMVLTGSYHGLCFSLIFKRNFAFYNRAHSSRILSLVHTLGIEDRDLANYPELSPLVDYSELADRIDLFRRKSEDFLLNILNLEGDSDEYSRDTE